MFLQYSGCECVGFGSCALGRLRSSRDVMDSSFLRRSFTVQSLRVYSCASSPALGTKVTGTFCGILECLQRGRISRKSYYFWKGTVVVAAAYPRCLFQRHSSHSEMSDSACQIWNHISLVLENTRLKCVVVFEVCQYVKALRCVSALRCVRKYVKVRRLQLQVGTGDELFLGDTFLFSFFFIGLTLNFG